MSPQHGGGGMGMHKHGTSGHSGKSPRFRLAAKMEAEKNQRRARRSQMYPTVEEALSKKWREHGG